MRSKGSVERVSPTRLWLKRQFDALGRDRQWWMLPVVLIMTMGLALLPGSGPDFLKVYYHASERGYTGFYYPAWSLFVLGPFDLLPPRMAHITFLLVQVACVVVAARYFGGDLRGVFLNYTAVRFLLLGQFDGLVLLGLVLLDWGLSRRRDGLAGLGLSLALVKPQVGLPLAVHFLLQRRRPWPLLVLAGVIVLSLALWPGWPGDLLGRLLEDPPLHLGNISLWQSIGVAALALWLAPMLPSMPEARRRVLIAATSALAMPYFQSHSLMLVYVMPIGLLPLLGNLGFFSILWGERALALQVVVPAIVYVWCVGQSLWEIGNKRRGQAGRGA